MDDAQSGAQPLGHDPPREVVQCDQPVRQLHRAQRRNGIGIDELVDVCAAQLQDHWPFGELRLEPFYRCSTPPSMYGHHHIGRLAVIVRYDPHPVAELPQDARPPAGGDAVTGA